jgi:superfamily II DNA/RNA helicase
MGLDERVVANLKVMGIEMPTAIQDGSIPLVIEGKDIVGLANTGTGKTAAFLLPLIHRILKKEVYQVLVMAPTRELAQQIEEEWRKFAQGLRLYSAICVGGTSMYNQIRSLQKDPHVVIGTPGRLKDLIEQGALRLEKCDGLVLDEADRMLDMGFLPDIKFIMAKLPTERQSLCFSATITPEINRLIDGILKSPETVSVRTGETASHVDQDVIVASSKEEKLAKLLELLAQPDYDKVLVFSQTKWGAQRLAEMITAVGYKAEAIHGNKTQAQRQKALRSFKEGNVSVLVATDVAARGLDISNVSHVINFDQPNTYQDYVHRIGRTGRAGKKGKALTFVSHHP